VVSGYSLSGDEATLAVTTGTYFAGDPVLQGQQARGTVTTTVTDESTVAVNVTAGTFTAAGTCTETITGNSGVCTERVVGNPGTCVESAATSVPADAALCAAVHQGTCTETATTSVVSDAALCAGVTGAQLLTEAACNAVDTSVGTDAGCTYSPPALSTSDACHAVDTSAGTDTGCTWIPPQSVPADKALCEAVNMGTCTETATISVPDDAELCAAVAGWALVTADFCRGVDTSVGEDIGCTWTPPAISVETACAAVDTSLGTNTGCLWTPPSSVPADAAVCAAVTDLDDATACNAADTSVGDNAGCSWTTASATIGPVQHYGHPGAVTLNGGSPADNPVRALSTDAYTPCATVACPIRSTGNGAGAPCSCDTGFTGGVMWCPPHADQWLRTCTNGGSTESEEACEGIANKNTWLPNGNPGERCLLPDYATGEVCTSDDRAGDCGYTSDATELACTGVTGNTYAQTLRPELGKCLANGIADIENDYYSYCMPIPCRE